MKQLGFPRSRRLVKQHEFKRVFGTGARKSNKYLTVYVHPVQGRRGKVGIVAGKRLGNAVERNRIRRSIRETIRTNQRTIKANKDIVVVARLPALQLPRRELTGQLISLLRKSEVLDA